MSQENFLLIYFFKQAVVLIAIIFIVYRYVRKGIFVIPLEKMIDCKLKTFMKQKEKYITAFANIILLGFIFNGFTEGTISAIREIPLIYRGEYSFVEGSVEKDSSMGSKNKIEYHNLYIREKGTQRIINLQVYGI